MAALTLPSVVLTHLNDASFAVCLPEPVTRGSCAQPVRVTAVQQDRPSLTTVAPEARCCRANLSTSRLRKPLIGSSLSFLGRRSAVVSTAATNGVLPAAPRPRLPLRSPPT